MNGKKNLLGEERHHNEGSLTAYGLFDALQASVGEEDLHIWMREDRFLRSPRSTQDMAVDVLEVLTLVTEDDSILCEVLQGFAYDQCTLKAKVKASTTSGGANVQSASDPTAI